MPLQVASRGAAALFLRFAEMSESLPRLQLAAAVHFTRNVTPTGLRCFRIHTGPSHASFSATSHPVQALTQQLTHPHQAVAAAQSRIAHLNRCFPVV